MKKLIKILLVSMITLLWSCNNSDLLNLTPIDAFAQSNFWKNEAQVKGFMDGIHSQFRGLQWSFFVLGELRDGQFSTDERVGPSLFSLEIVKQTIDENSVGMGSWGSFYDKILQINTFIEQVEKIEFLTPEKKNLFLGQAYGLRAFYYFHLLRTYGGVPLRLKPDVIYNSNDVALRLARSTEAEVLTQIKKDVDHSVELFENKAASAANKGYWSIDASRMLKGEVYLWSAKVYNTSTDFETAKKALMDIGATTYSLITAKGNASSAFANVFAYENKKNKEIILALHSVIGEGGATSNVSGFLPDNITHTAANSFYREDFTGNGYSNANDLKLTNFGSQRYRYDIKLYNLYGFKSPLTSSNMNSDYESIDQRRDATFLALYITAPDSKFTFVKKFLGTVNGSNNHDLVDDWPVYREADRLLLLAEIANAQSDLTIVNANLRKVRERAGLTHVDVANTGDNAEIAIFEERLKEFVWEGKGWYDLRRMKVGGKPMAFKSTLHNYGVLDEGTEGYKLLWPIEKNIWTTDPLVNQTPGYATTKP